MPEILGARSKPQHPVVFFDGICSLCNGFVDFILARDRHAVFRFSPLQGKTFEDDITVRTDSASSETGSRREAFGSVVLWDAEGAHARSEAVLRILKGLGGPWMLLGYLRIVPRPLRDAIYDAVARSRYGLFGRRETCRVPSVSERGRFLP